jgi:RNA-directed DNA polymerase
MCQAVRFLSLIESKDIQNKVINFIVKRFDKIPNVGYLEIWLQRVTLKIDEKRKFDEKLCQKLINKSIIIWDSKWLGNKLRNIIENETTINDQTIQSLNKVINIEEVQLFNSKNNYFD